MMQTTMDARRSLLLVVDVQARLAPAIDEGAAAVENNRRLLQAAQRLQVPVLVTEHYPQGLGATVEPLQAPMAAAGATVIEKIHFGATREPGFLERLRGFGRRQIVLTGMEAHICVLQTGLGLLEAGFAVAVVADASSSRTRANREAGLARLARHGAEIVTTEMVIYEWLERAGTADFRALLPLVR